MGHCLDVRKAQLFLDDEIVEQNAYTLGGSGNGGLWSEVLGEDLKPIAGLTRLESDALRGDGTQVVATWGKEASAIERVKGQWIRLKFHVENTDLFSFRASG